MQRGAGTLLQHASNRYSQKGEDGVLEEILRRLEIGGGWFVEFGAWDGKYLSNTYALLEQGWSGVHIEGDAERFRDLAATASASDGRLLAIPAYVAIDGPQSLDALLAGTPVPRSFEVLSVDVDSYDYWIWHSLSDYEPKIVVIEINSSIPLDEYVTPERAATKPGEVSTGASFQAMLELGREKGYTLVCHTGNMIFVRDDLVGRVGLPQHELDRPELPFVPEPVDRIPPWLRRLTPRRVIRGLARRARLLGRAS